VADNRRISSASANTALAVAALSISATAAAQTPPTDEVDTVVVTGVRQSLTQGLENKREAIQVIESVVAEDIGKLPDNNVIEALQRVTGVQVTNRGGGEASSDPNSPGIFIRGLSDITTTWNGRNVFTGVGRALALQDIPANLIGRVDVFKTRASDQIETGLAGQIDVRTRRPFDLPGFEMSLVGRATQQDQRDDSLDPNLSFLVGNSWDSDAGRFGALFNVSYSRVRYRDQSITAGAEVPFVTATGPLPPASRRCSASSTAIRRSGRPVPTAACPTSPARLSTSTPVPAPRISPIYWRAMRCSPATSRAIASVPPPTSRCSGHRTTARNTPSKPSTRAIARRCSTTSISPSRTGGARWVRSGLDHHAVPGHEHHQDARGRRAFRFQQR
jgi:hypothetical protein